jgi:hypothetical protein
MCVHCEIPVLRLTVPQNLRFINNSISYFLRVCQTYWINSYSMPVKTCVLGWSPECTFNKHHHLLRIRPGDLFQFRISSEIWISLTFDRTPWTSDQGVFSPAQGLYLDRIILLHVWGFLGDVTWALSRNDAVVHFNVSLATQQFKRRAYPQHCYRRDNRHGDVSMATG